MEEKYLPVGTVVKLKDGIKAIMITGFCPISTDDGKMYDYSACLYPEGVVGPEMNLLFDHNQIAEVLYKGFVSNEETVFKQKLNEIMFQKNLSGESPNVANQNNSAVNSQSTVHASTINAQTTSPFSAVGQPQMFSANQNQQ